MAAKLTAKVAAAYGNRWRRRRATGSFRRSPGAGGSVGKGAGHALRRAEALIHLAQAAIDGELPLTAPDDIDAGMKQLQTLPGIGRWTASYFARGWQAKDIFLPDDYLIKQRFPGMTPARLRVPAAGNGVPMRCCISGIAKDGRRLRNSHAGGISLVSTR
jgi:DNA-3-methyladenine glycosylase II